MSSGYRKPLRWNSPENRAARKFRILALPNLSEGLREKPVSTGRAIVEDR
ncbi:hypothetical protein JL2886_00231 [Phaeobacter gallaeciensis]|uniref:Uncharacterized protein n=1 Tax=Phaeobacter gallaeciensis TaxID=60890 RepID=A0A1B0ZLZ6_9RHOB|nr:hypothetical protein JL2886_00231 [Phaeobacter gallaeciensis]